MTASTVAVETMLNEAAELLSERLTGEQHWSHAHCDEASDGTHRLDYEWWEEDARGLIERIKEATNPTGKEK